MADACFMCDPSILEDGQRCATGAPICDMHRDELTGNQNPELKRLQAENKRLRDAGEDMAAAINDLTPFAQWPIGAAAARTGPVSSVQVSRRARRVDIP